MKGIQRACAETWPDTRIQRCLVHVQRDTRADLTGKPRLQAGRELKRLADMLARVHDPDAAVRWGGAPDAWHGRWKRMLAERTYAKDNPDDPRAAVLLQCLFSRLISIFPQCGRMVFPGLVIMQSVM